MLFLLTPTGGRPQAWAICQRLMLAQNYSGPVTWIVVDDGQEPQPVTFHRPGWTLRMIRPDPPWRDGENTHARNLLCGLQAVPANERVVMIEDDDHYANDWLSLVDDHLDQAELVGQQNTRYYNVRTRRGREMTGEGRASLCATALRGTAIERFRAICRDHKTMLDVELWRQHPSKHLFNGHRVVGIKGFPGRSGIGVGHRDYFRGTDDQDGQLLRTWVGNDAELYAGL